MAENTYTVQRSTTVDAPPARIYDQIADFHSWVAWSPWEALDPNLKRSYEGAGSGTGAAYGWSGNRKGRSRADGDHRGCRALESAD